VRYHLAKLDHVAVGQAHQRVRRREHAVHQRAVGARQVDQRHPGSVAQQQSVAGRDGDRFQHDIVIVVAADCGCALDDDGAIRLAGFANRELSAESH
jgi:hypothetical protein